MRTLKALEATTSNALLQWLATVLKQVASERFGWMQNIVNHGQVVQIEKTGKIRLAPTAGTLTLCRPRNANPASSATRARSAGFGLDWYLNRNVRAVVNYNWTGFDGPVTNPTRVASKDEQAVFTREPPSFQANTERQPLQS